MFDPCECTIHQLQQPPRRLLHHPVNVVKTYVTQFAGRALFEQATTQRTLSSQAIGLDANVYHSAIKQAQDEHIKPIRATFTLSIIDQSLVHRFDRNMSPMWCMCGAIHDSIEQFIWDCPHPVLVGSRTATENKEQLTLLKISDQLPTAFKIGLPIMNMCPKYPLWKDHHCETRNNTILTKD